jgi:hypothetical protein
MFRRARLMLFNTKDVLLQSITYENLINTIYCNEKTKDKEAVKRVFNELLKIVTTEAKIMLKNNMNNILKELEE